MPPRDRWNRRWRTRAADAAPTAPSSWLVENRPAPQGAASAPQGAASAPQGAASAPQGGASAPADATAGRRALDVACGAGRNATYLAEIGFVVDAVDISDVAIEALRADAAARGLDVHPHRMDLEREPLPAGPYDLVLVINYLQRDLFPSLAGVLGPGGMLLMETFTRRHLGLPGNRIDPRHALEPGELRRAFPDLRLVRYREGVSGVGDHARAVASLRAERPRGEGPPG
jgi:tellurite methyltransferase